MRRFLRDNGLTLVLLVLFGCTLGGQAAAGFRVHNQDQQDHGEETVGLGTYLRSGHFVEAVFENWESEFLQMGFYVVLTTFLFQRGSAESNDPDAPESPLNNPAVARTKGDAPWPVRQGGLVSTLYGHSLGLALAILFVGSFVLHANGGAREYNAEQIAHGGDAVSTLDFLGTARFWFESFQNWQSEFLSIAVLVILSIFLRERGSPESKPLGAPHRATGAD